jgi:hypothetical protein
MKDEGALEMPFSDMSESIGSMCRHILFAPGAVPAFLSGRKPGCNKRRKAQVLPIVRDEFGPATP